MTNPIHVPDAPPVSGLAFRRLRGADDLPGMLAVRQVCGEFDQVDPLSAVQSVPTLESLQRMMTPSPGFDPANDLLVVTVNESIVGYGATGWWTETDGTRLYLSLGWLVPGWRGRGIGTAMLHWGEAHLHQVATSHPAQGKAFYGANASETERDATALLLNEGYKPAFSVIEMGIASLSQLPSAPMPPGFVTRPLERADLPAVYRSMTECYQESPFSEPEEEEQVWVAKQQDLAAWHVAWDVQTGEVAGQVQATIYKGRGELDEVSVRGPHRRKGLAKALIVHGLESLRSQGMTTARLHTLAENIYRSPRVYESVGFQVLKKYPRYRKAM